MLNKIIGHILRPTERIVSSKRSKPRIPREEDDIDEEDEDEDDQQDVKEMESLAEFDDVVIWEHGAAPTADNDPYVKGIQEWVALAEAAHRSDGP